MHTDTGLGAWPPHLAFNLPAEGMDKQRKIGHAKRNARAAPPEADMDMLAASRCIQCWNPGISKVLRPCRPVSGLSVSQSHLIETFFFCFAGICASFLGGKPLVRCVTLDQKYKVIPAVLIGCSHICAASSFGFVR
jgi:hypothetical protein